MSFDFTFELSLVHALVLISGWLIGNLSALKQTLAAVLIAVVLWLFVFSGDDAEDNGLIMSHYGDSSCDNSNETGGYDANGVLNICIRK